MASRAGSCTVESCLTSEVVTATNVGRTIKHGGIDRERFISMGDEVQHSLIGNAKLLPSHRVLDVGCGCGKLARPLTTYLNSKGGYDGIDITREVINWCKERYQNYPNFRFCFADLYSERYNPKGAFNASNYEFPFPNNEFDVVYVGSVFTHMVSEDMDNYIAEIARVMKLGGICLATYFILDAVSRENIAAGLTYPKFADEFKSQTCRVENAGTSRSSDRIRREISAGPLC